MDFALQSALPLETGKENVLAFFTRLLERLLHTQTQSLSADERALLKLAHFGADRFGARLLDADSVDDLDGRVDEIIADPEYVNLWRLLLSSAERMAIDPAILRPSLSGDTEGTLRSILGAGSTKSIAQGCRYLQTAASLLPTVKEMLEKATGQHWETVAGMARELTGEQPPLAFLYDQDLPIEIAEFLLDGERANALMFAILALGLSGTEFKADPWLRLAVAERWARGMRGGLQLLAAMLPEAQVDESVLPPSERLDLNAIAAKHQRFVGRFDALCAAADRANEPVFPREY